LKGKLAYMAPEQVRGDPLTRRTDVYAASVVLWEVLTGKRLFYAENEASVLARVLNADVPPPSTIVPSLPRSFDRVVLRGLERDPAKRYASAREMAADLDAVVGVASPTEIGEWVERTAADELRERAALIAETERSAAEAVEVPQLASGPANDRDAGSGKRARESHWHQTTKREGVPVIRDVSQVSSLSLARASEPPGRPSRRLVSAIVVSAGAVVLLLLLLVLSRARLKSGDAHVDPAVTAASKPGEPVPHASGDAVTNVEDLPHARANAPAPPAADSETAAAVRPPPPVRQGPTAAVPAGNAVRSPPRGEPAPVPSAQAPAPSASAAPDCNPPYTADAKGHIHFKPNCM
jgi:serine/threonine-protein kinase